MKRAFLFPGQGAQVVGMGKDIYEKYPEAKFIYDKACEITGMDIVSLCFEGPEEKLNKTEYTQLCILVTSLAILEVLKQRGINSDLSVGLSLGEYTALIHAGFLTLEDGIKLVQKRGYFMGNLLPKEKYEMAAVIGLESSKIEEICQGIREQGKFIVPANYNCSVQTAISGEAEAVTEAISKLKEAGAKKVIPLKTSGPFHTEKLEEAKNAFEKELQNVTFHNGNNRVIKNLDGNFYQETENFQEVLAKHIVSPVRFDKAIELMKAEGIEQYVEIGTGKVLTGFVRKEVKDVELININNVESLQAFLEKEEV